MSEQSLQAEWQPTGDLNVHMDRFQQGLTIMQNQIVLPTDDRWQLAYAMLATGKGQDSGVMTKGPFGAVKTTMGNLMLGEDQMVSIDGTDTAHTLFGHDHPNPTADSPRFIEGKFKVVDPTNPVFFLNELPHMRIQKPVQKLWDMRQMDIPTNNGHPKSINLEEAAYYVTGNYPNGIDVFRLSGSILSRMAVEVLVGDVDEEKARKIQSSAAVSFAEAPILPSAASRRDLNELVTAAYTNPQDKDGNTVTGNFTVDLISQLNASGLVAPISLADARIGKTLESASRAYMFRHRNEAGTAIEPLVAARAAALVMPTVAKLSHAAEDNMNEYLETSVSDVAKDIAIRRLIAREAFTVAFRRLAKDDKAIARDGKPLSRYSPEALKDEIDARVDSFSYGDQTFLSYDVDEALAGPAEEAAEAETPRRILGVRIPRKR